jgi:tripartite-type tricarboxylate transporter receptor subunit TctC
MRCVLILTLGAALATGCGWTSAQTKYPSRPVRVIVPYTPGGITDVATRMVTQELVKSLGQNVIVDNRPGANSIVGVEMVAKSSPDGYTLASVIAAHAANQTLYAKLPYDSIKSFAPVSLLVTAPLIVCVTNTLPVKTPKELIELAKAKPGQLTFASSGIGAAAHLTTELLMLTTGVKMIHVPYKGTAPALLDLTGGQVTVMMDTPGSMLPHARAGKIRALAMASEKRVAVAPELPTLTE